MDFIDQIQELASKVHKQQEHIQTEEATKNAFTMPFINALGYNVFDPTEVVPEFVADVGIKKGEKVDYAIMKDNEPIILFECKASNVTLDDGHASQLYRYFATTKARIGVLTNGIIYKFYSDLEEPNKMDTKPFVELDMENIHEPIVAELKKLTKSSFDLDQMLSTASDMKYTREIKRMLKDQLTSPSEDFVYFLASKVYSGKVTQSVREQFTGITKRAFRQFVNETLNERLKSAMTEESLPVPEHAHEEIKESIQLCEKPLVERTDEELEGYYIVKSILRNIVDPSRIIGRDTQSYFGVLLDDNNRKPICRLHFNRAQKYIGLFDSEKNETREPIEKLDDIFNFVDKLKETIGYYV